MLEVLTDQELAAGVEHTNQLDSSEALETEYAMYVCYLCQSEIHYFWKGDTFRK